MQGIKEVYISGLTFTTKMDPDTQEKVNNLIIKLCEDEGYRFINNGNITGRHLFKDGLHLLESGKCVLANNFISSLDYFLSRYKYHPNIHIHKTY